MVMAGEEKPSLLLCILMPLMLQRRNGKIGLAGNLGCAGWINSPHLFLLIGQISVKARFSKENVLGLCLGAELEKKRKAERQAREAQERELRKREKAEEKERRRREYDALRIAKQKMTTQQRRETGENQSKKIMCLGKGSVV